MPFWHGVVQHFYKAIASEVNSRAERMWLYMHQLYSIDLGAQLLVQYIGVARLYCEIIEGNTDKEPRARVIKFNGVGSEDSLRAM